MSRQASREISGQLQAKLKSCRSILRSLKRVVVAFSAGADSTLLLALSVETLGSDNVLAATAVSASMPRRELSAARQLAQQLGAELIEVHTAELSDPRYTSNPPNRCYYCKLELFTRLGKLAAERGFHAVVSGANADDTGEFRPGLKAGQRLGVRNPLLEAGLNKNDIRLASKAMGLTTWNKPAMACLASRVPYGRHITERLLHRIERAEEFLKKLGLAQCRVRDHGAVARIEVPPEQMPLAMGSRKQIVEVLKSAGYTYVALDMEGFRSGSMNESLRKANDAG